MHIRDVNGEMERPRGPVVVAVVSVVCLATAWVHQILTPVDADYGWAFRGFVLVMAVPYVILGAAVAMRHPGNVIGRLLQTMGLLFTGVDVIAEYAMHGLVYDPGSWPAGIAAAWVIQWAWTVAFGLSMFIFLLFPNGEFLSERWRRFSYFAGLSLFIAAFGFGTSTGVMDSFTTRPPFQNPLGIEGLSADTVGFFIAPWLGSLVASTVSLFIRFHRSSGVERLQLKWLAMGALFTAVAFFFPLGVPEAPVLGQVLTTAGIVLLPTTIAIAVLRYRLYDIDVLINRALVYALLTAALVLAYVSLVFGFQAVLAPFAAESDLAIAGSTLAVAALFRPVRARVQDFIDRRFYRRKFDAERTVAEFSVHLRNEVELSAVTTQLAGVVRETMQPSHVSVWIRPVSE